MDKGSKLILSAVVINIVPMFLLVLNPAPGTDTTLGTGLMIFAYIITMPIGFVLFIWGAIVSFKKRKTKPIRLD